VRRPDRAAPERDERSLPLLHAHRGGNRAEPEAHQAALAAPLRARPARGAGKLTPWDLDALVPYADEYLAGFRSESYAIDLPGGFERAKAMMLPQIRASIRRDIGGDVQRIATMHSEYHDITFKHLLLPMWICAYRYKGRVFQILVNARTGEVVGDRPYSWAKITLSVVMALLCIGAIVLFFVLASR
jgi:hypothetical protein